MIAIYRFGSYVPVPGSTSTALQKFFESGGAGVVGFLDLFSGGALAARRRVRARHHAVHHGVDHHAAAHRGHPQARGAGQRGRAGPEADHQVHPLAHRRPLAGAVGRLHRAVPPVRRAARPQLVARRARSSPASSPAPSIVMWLGELITARGIGNGMSIIIFISIVSRIPSGAAQLVHARPAADRPLHGHRPGGGRGGHLDHHGRAPRPGAVRQTGGRPPHDGRAEHVHPAQGQHGRRHPGHLRLVGDDDHPDVRAVPGHERRRRLVQPDVRAEHVPRTSSARPSSSSSSRTSTRR